MRDEILASLYDIQHAGAAIMQFVDGKRRDDYETDEFLRSAVERKFEIIGEALCRIRKVDPAILDRIREHRIVVSFRNILVHGYDSIDNQIVWGIIAEDLARLLSDVEGLLDEAGDAE